MLLAEQISHTSIQYMDFVEIFHVSQNLSTIHLLILVGVELPVCVIVTLAFFQEFFRGDLLLCKFILFLDQISEDGKRLQEDKLPQGSDPLPPSPSRGRKPVTPSKNALTCFLESS